MSFDVLQDKIIETQNPTVAGLDARIEYVPEHIRKACYEQYGLNLRGACEAIWQFNVGLIDALCDVVPAVKPQAAYYENLGWRGMELLERNISYAKRRGLFVIADIQRGDIGSPPPPHPGACSVVSPPPMCDTPAGWWPVFVSPVSASGPHPAVAFQSTD